MVLLSPLVDQPFSVVLLVGEVFCKSHLTAFQKPLNCFATRKNPVTSASHMIYCLASSLMMHMKIVNQELCKVAICW